MGGVDGWSVVEEIIMLVDRGTKCGMVWRIEKRGYYLRHAVECAMPYAVLMGPETCADAVPEQIKVTLRAELKAWADTI